MCPQGPAYSDNAEMLLTGRWTGGHHQSNNNSKITLILTLMQDAAADREVGLITLIITGWTGLIARSGPKLTVNKSW